MKFFKSNLEIWNFYFIGLFFDFRTIPQYARVSISKIFGQKKKKKTTIIWQKRPWTWFSRRHGTDARRKLGTDADKLLAQSRGGDGWR